MTDIVTVNVSQTIAPTPSQLQKSGALISQGGTTQPPGSSSFLAELADITALLTAAKAVTSATWSGTTVQLATITTTQVHGLTLNNVYQVTLAGIASTTPGAYNGTWNVTITGTSTFTFTLPLSGAPGAGTGGTWAPASSGELLAMATTFFAQGSAQGVYVLELGAGNSSQGVAALSAFITANNNPQKFYSYLIPRSWDANADFLALANQFESTTAKTYFFVTTTLATYHNYTALQKGVVAMVEAPAYGIWGANVLSAISYAGAWAVNDFTALAWSGASGGQVTGTTTTAHGVLPGQSFTTSGSTPAGYNGTFTALPGTTGSTLIWALAVDPGAESALGQLNASAGGLVTGTTTTAHGVTVGKTFTISGSIASTIPGGYNGTFTALPGTTASTLIYALAADPGAITSVHGQLNASSYVSAGIGSLEFSLAAPFFVTLNYNPSTTNKVTPTAYSFLFDVTPFPTQGNAATLSALAAAFVNWVGTGAQGGISNTILFNGTTKDGRDFTYWYSVDWVQINLSLNLANAIINGSNNTINPLYYNQDGINRLQQVGVATLNSGLTFGLVLGAVKLTQLDGAAFTAALNAGDFEGFTVINAVPFVPYNQANPTHYAIGQYDGLSCVYTPTRGFLHIIFNVNVTDFVAA